MLSYLPAPRIAFLLGFAACDLLLGIAAYFQFSEGLEPCPLCISQRLMVLAVGLVMLIAGLHNPKKASMQRIYGWVGCAVALAGAGVSGRHVWLQHLPEDQVPACGPGLEYMLKHFPLGETLQAMLTGTGDCAKVDWTMLGLSMPAWVLMAFLGLALWSGLQAWYAGRNNP